MALKKLLLVPAERLIRPVDCMVSAPPWRRVKERIKEFLPSNRTRYSAEIQFYGDIPQILGPQNVFSFGRYNPVFLQQKLPEYCPYPSVFGQPAPTFFSKNSLDGILRNCDAVFVSTSAGERGDVTIARARAFNKPVAIIDFLDHPSLYHSSPQETERDMFRGFVYKKHFDIYFKKDLLPEHQTDIVRPIAPVPVRPEMFYFNEAHKDISLFYSGTIQERTQADRREIIELLQKRRFHGMEIRSHESSKTFLSVREYFEKIARSKIILSPSGVVWDSIRHAEVGLAPKTMLIAPKPYIETAGPPLVDGENALLYDTELRGDGKYHLVKENELMDKVRYYLQNDSERERVAARWQRDVLRGHTILARSRYILESIEKIL